MIFYSLKFLIFFCIVIVCVQFAPNIKWQNGMLLAANIVFYSCGNIYFLILIFAVITVCYFAALQYKRHNKGIWINTAVLGCLLIMFVFKYMNFFADIFVTIFRFQESAVPNIILPLGISFYLFQAMSYLFDVRDGITQVERNFIKLAVYISFFPQITSGPIVKSHDFLPQLNNLHRIKKENFYRGFQIFLVGLTKKVVFADRIGIAVDAVYNAPVAYNSISILCAIMGYSLQIYCDFSGYSDMAVGIASILGFDLGKNFNAPYLASNVSDFWQRWHISLSSWFRDYVYIPLGGNRKGKFRTYFNLFITMFLSGLWHGANLTYIIWGCIHGISSIINKMCRGILKRKKSMFNSTISIIINFSFISFTWVIFRSDNIHQALDIFRGLLQTEGITYINIYVVFYLILMGVVNFWALYKNKGNVLTINMDLDKMIGKIVVAIWIFLIIMLMYCGNSAFIYAQF